MIDEASNSVKIFGQKPNSQASSFQMLGFSFFRLLRLTVNRTSGKFLFPSYEVMTWQPGSYDKNDTVASDAGEVACNLQFPVILTDKGIE